MSTLTRRDFLRHAAGLAAFSASGWLGWLAANTADDPARKRPCILLWMNGGPSQMDTFDLKPGHANGGPYREIRTAVPGLRISEHLPRVAKQADRLALVRSMTSKEGDHGRATFLAKTGYLPQGPVQYPPLGALVANQAGRGRAELPGFVSVAPLRTLTPSALGPGFLGPLYAPLVVGEKSSADVAETAANPDQLLKVPDLSPPAAITPARAADRVGLLQGLQDDFLAARKDAPPAAHQAAIDGAVRLMRPAAARAFDLSQEPAAVRDAYGRTLFGQGCLLARRLVERGVPFVEVTLGSSADGTSGWDTHADNFEVVKWLSQVLDPAWSTLMDDLDQRGLLDSTLVVWMGEFGRTPKINQLKGRDHYPAAWSAVLAGGGIQGGSVIGKTSADGGTVEERPVTVPDFLATVCLALGIDPTGSNLSNVGRPISVVDKAANPLREILT
jgi:uncharacterized protein (DUF1501 family)